MLLRLEGHAVESLLKLRMAFVIPTQAVRWALKDEACQAAPFNFELGCVSSKHAHDSSGNAVIVTQRAPAT